MKSNKSYLALHRAIIEFYLDGYCHQDAIDLVRDMKGYQRFAGSKFNAKTWKVVK